MKVKYFIANEEVMSIDNMAYTVELQDAYVIRPRTQTGTDEELELMIVYSIVENDKPAVANVEVSTEGSGGGGGVQGGSRGAMGNSGKDRRDAKDKK